MRNKRRHSFTHINVNVGDQLGCDVHASLFDSAFWEIWIAVPGAAHGVGIRGGRWGMLDTSGGHNPHRFTSRAQNQNQNHDQAVFYKHQSGTIIFFGIRDENQEDHRRN